MRILWNEQENWFQVELSLNEHFNNDLEIVKSVGLKTTGPPEWIWHTSRSSILSKLRSKNPKSGLVITSLALEKFNFLHEQETRKAEMRKAFIKARTQADRDAAVKPEEWQIDPELGFEVHISKKSDKKFKFDFHPPKLPDTVCFICGDPIYMYDYPDLCLWCDKQQKISLDNLES